MPSRRKELAEFFGKPWIPVISAGLGILSGIVLVILMGLDGFSGGMIAGLMLFGAVIGLVVQHLGLWFLGEYARGGTDSEDRGDGVIRNG
jgi:hypothetical protein